MTLREITADTVRQICNLRVRDDQVGFVAPNAVSIAEAHFSPHAWFRAIYADEAPVGFVMLEEKPGEASYYLWRFMIDGRNQGLGYGRRALELVIARVRTLPGATELICSVVPKPGGPQPFYEGMGFVATGDFEDGEAVLRLDLAGGAASR